MIEITPKTKVGELLDNFPQLEDVLLQISPAFASLKNPILRRTVAKVAALQQAAAIGGVKVEELVNRLRREVGQEPLFGDADSEYLSGEPPQWFDATKVVLRFDACEVIQSGGSPMNQILEQTKTLNEGEIYELITPFVPAPIIDMLKQKGFNAASVKSGSTVANWVIKTP
ncbi:MAG: DUF1858 domain-containing protein [Bacteroidota bacterium]|nr:DUF1858 domain-containing protein [Bacteroidota bacterium]